jgi:uncharacterized damage-inducible protein DinB
MSEYFKTSLAAEIDSELSLCRQIFECLPSSMLAWKPHEKSPSAGSLAAHICDMAEWIKLAATTEELDYAKRDHIGYEPATTDDLLRYFDERASDAARSIDRLSKEELQTVWRVRHGKRVFIERAREHVVRVDSLHHIIHHRGQLTVYCRLKDVAIPGVYGPN